jgi:hypothetical protein
LPQRYSFRLVERAMQRKAIIVLTRGRKRWLSAVPALTDYAGLCLLRNPQTATISPQNCDRFLDVVHAIENHQPSRP